MAAKNFDYTSREHAQGPKHGLPVGANEKAVVPGYLERGFRPPKSRKGRRLVPETYDQEGAG